LFRQSWLNIDVFFIFCSHFESPVAVESRLAEYLGNLKSNLLLDIHMRSHVDALYELITQQAVLYRIELAPFDVKAQIASKLMKVCMHRS
jgi:hypothetical protein